MPIIGSTFSIIHGEKKGKISPDMNINSSLKVEGVERTKGAQEDSNLLEFSFEFSVEYQNAGSILLKGVVMFVDEKKKIDQILKSYVKDKSIPSEVKTLIYNHALYRASIKALMLSEELRLPAHIRLPHVESKQSNK